MGEKYRNGAANYGSVVRNRLKFLIPASILLVFVVWNSSSLSPFDVVSYGPVSYTILSHQEGNNVQDGRSENEVSKTEAEAIAAQYDRLKSLIPSQVEVADPNAEKLDDDANEESPSQSEQAPAEREEIQVAPIQTEEPEVTPTETEESEVAQPQTEESEVAPAQTEVVENAPAQTEDLEEDPAQTEEVEEDPAQTEEVEVAPAQTEEVEEDTAQTEEVEEDPAQTEEVEVAPAQTEEVVKAPAQTEEVVKAPAQTEEVVKAPAQTKESEVAPAQTEKSEVTPVQTEQPEVAPARTEELEVAPARTEVSVDTRAGDSESKAEVKEPPVQTREAPARTEEKVEALVRREEKVEAPVQTEVESSHSEVLTIENARQEATRNPDSGKTEEEEDAAPDENPSGIDAARFPFIMGNKTHLAGTDKWKLGLLGSDLKYLEETIRSKMLPYSTRKGAEHEGCDGKYMYVYELPEEYNKELAERCETLFPWFSLCPYVVDSGRGLPVNAVDNGTQIFVPGDKWFNTHQYALEMVSHARALKYRCRTWDREKANLFYIPYYAGLDVIRWHFDPKTTNDAKDALSLKLVGWLKQQKEFVRRGGRDHVLVLGKISWDFRRQPGASWGSRMLEFPELKDMTRLMIERDPWCKYDIGVPHPTYFHPTSAADIDQWLAHVRAQKRTYLVTFVGKERKNDPKNPRTALVRQCLNVTSADDCKFVECDRSNCLHPAFVTRAFLATHFCMQPVGDSPTRRSVFDSLIAGCIPVLFHPQTAYTQYPWHLPRNESLYSVYIPEEDVIKGTVSVVDELKKITVAQRDAMREYIINTMIPGLIYSAPGADVSPYRDAFDISIDQVLHRSKLSLGMDDSH